MTAATTTLPVNHSMVDDPNGSYVSGDETSPYEGLVYTVFQRLREALEGGLVIAVTATNPREGVTHTINGIVDRLARDRSSRTLRVNAQSLRQASVRPSELPQSCVSLRSNLFTLDANRSSVSRMDQRFSWEGNWNYRRDCIEQLRREFDYVLIDCPCLSRSTDLLSLAPFVDGVILIIEAGRTRKSQVLQAERAIEEASGRLIGHVLNKRTYIVPDWLYRRL